MREIKFRAWDKLRGILFINSINWNLLTGKIDIVCGNGFGLDRFELMQFTGLKDKNGKDIYEGDIVKVQRFKTKFFNAEVDFSAGTFWIEGGLGLTHPIHYIDFEKIEVIGNKFENPELLKK